MTFAALLDTSVLWPSTQRDFLLSLAVEGLYRPLWSEVILDELELHEAEKLVDRLGLDKAEAGVRAAYLRQQMTAAFDDSVVIGWEPLEGTYGLPDPDDEHVLAAGVMGGAGALVTSNLRHFPTSAVPNGIHVLPPHEFALNTVAVDPIRSLRAVDAMVARSGSDGRPGRSREDIIDVLVDRYAMSAVAALLSESC